MMALVLRNTTIVLDGLRISHQSEPNTDLHSKNVKRRDGNVLRVTKSRWQRQLLWALAKMGLLCSEKRWLAEEAVNVGVCKILHGCPNKHNHLQRNSSNGENFKNRKITDKNN